MILTCDCDVTNSYFCKSCRKIGSEQSFDRLFRQLAILAHEVVSTGHGEDSDDAEEKQIESLVISRARERVDDLVDTICVDRDFAYEFLKRAMSACDEEGST